jgi:hypothetical protein
MTVLPKQQHQGRQMPNAKKVEIGLQIEPQYGFSYEEIRDLGKLAE